MTELRCPTCNRLHRPEPDAKTIPFCSERCQLIDLGRWLGEKHSVPYEGNDDDLDGELDADYDGAS
ncbi:MAG: DNA gyrase inhibitor YacG [Planctomycetales bacterium]|nr:DNA gyrase inhibitor YacG [Planctomycetales bacterium]